MKEKKANIKLVCGTNRIKMGNKLLAQENIKKSTDKRRINLGRIVEGRKITDVTVLLEENEKTIQELLQDL